MRVCARGPVSSTTYQPRRPAQGALHQLVRDHFETFRAQAAHLRDGQGLPRFVEQAAFERSATASLAEALAEAGVSRLPDVRVSGGWLRAVPVFGLPTRSTGPVLLQGARILSQLRRSPMTDRAAHLVDHVFPAVAIRQWVLTLPPRLRYLLACVQLITNGRCRGSCVTATGVGRRVPSPRRVSSASSRTGRSHATRCS